MRIVALISLLLSACGSFPINVGTGSEGPRTASDADRLYAAAAYIEAARSYLSEAQVHGGDAQIEYLLRAADAAALGRAAAELALALEQLSGRALLPTDALRFQVYRAEWLLLNNQARAALDLLPSPPLTDEPAIAARQLQALGEAHRQLGDGPGAIAALVARNAWLTGAQRESNHELIWTWLRQTENFAAAAPLQAPDYVSDGWLQLGQIARNLWREEGPLETALADWQSRFATHPANPRWVVATRDYVRGALLASPGRVALLLPLNGRLAGPAAAIRDGFFAAYYRYGGGTTAVSLYDSSQDAAAAYDQALADGAEIVVGPLDKPGVTALTERSVGEVPVLALNYLDTPGPAQKLVQFGLAPEDEAVAVADRAIIDGRSRAIVLTGTSDWARRSSTAFSQRFTEAGGRVLETQYFSGNAREYPDTIRSLLNLNDSSSRHSALERLLGTNLEFEPTRRLDADMVFLAASPEEGRQIRPQFRFYHAADLPMYAGERIYTGHPDREADQDLNGVRFCVMPWLLDDSEELSAVRAQSSRLWPDSERRFSRLFAIGYDAFTLLPLIRSGTWSAGQVFPGATGNLSLARQDQRIQRQLPCAQFVGGRARRLSAGAEI